MKLVLRAALRAALVLSAATALFALINILLGCRPIAIASASMAPEIYKDDLIFIERVEPDELREGDIITFRQPGTNVLVTHRIESISVPSAGVYTRGEQAEKADPDPVPYENIAGRYRYRLPAVGGLFY